MSKLEQLSQIADEMLGGLNAEQALLQKVLYRQSREKARAFSWQRGFAYAAALMLVIGAAVFLNRPPEAAPLQMETQAAGETSGMRMAAYAVPRGSITLKKTNDAPKYHGLWSRGSGANFPMLMVDGRVYRMLTNPTNMDQSMLDAPIGVVSTMTEEPALEEGAACVSNIVPVGGNVYAVSGMRNAAAAAMVDGKMRVFQRVSFSGKALSGAESLRDTLGAGRVVALQLSGVGTVTDETRIQSLMAMLASASYQSASSRSTKQALLIQFDNHIVLQLAVKDDKLIGCGTWSCPGFADAFREACQ